MSLKRVVDTRFWNQVDVMERYSSQDKLFALYLMTCPRATQLGIYSLPKRVIASDMRLDDEHVGQLLARLPIIRSSPIPTRPRKWLFWTFSLIA